jgi:NAD(P)-dependent dehydrogenase (short-subunit alcohol dehydrogenase family)
MSITNSARMGDTSDVVAGRVDIAGKSVLITGANRGIGRALVLEALDRGAARVYAATRKPAGKLAGHHETRVVPLIFDVRAAHLIRAAADQVPTLDLLINNAGISMYDDLSDRALLEQHLDVNLFGPYEVTRAFLPQLIRAAGAIVNVLSLAAVASVPVIPAYSVSKAAALSMSQAQRALLAARGVRVHAVLAGPTDTEMSRDLTVPKASAESVAAAIFDGLLSGADDIFPDPLSQTVGDGWQDGPIKVLERANAELVAGRESIAS